MIFLTINKGGSGKNTQELKGAIVFHTQQVPNCPAPLPDFKCTVPKAGNTEVICIPSEVCDRPQILMDLDNKLLTFVEGIRSRGGVINVHVV